MVGLTLCLLVGAVGVTEEDQGALAAENRALHALNILEFMTVVGKEQRQTKGKQFFSEGFFQNVQHAHNSSRSMTFQTEVELHVEGDKVEGKDDAGVLLFSLHTVHLYHGSIMEVNIVSIILVKMPLLGDRRSDGFMGMSTWFALDSHGEIHVTHIQFAFVNQAADGGLADRKGVFIILDDMEDRLSLTDERADQAVDLLELRSGKIKPVAGIDQQGAVLFLCKLWDIETLFKVTKALFMAGIAQVCGGVKECVAISFGVIRTILFGFGAGLALFVTAGSATDMSKGTV